MCAQFSRLNVDAMKSVQEVRKMLESMEVFKVMYESKLANDLTELNSKYNQQLQAITKQYEQIVELLRKNKDKIPDVPK